MPVERRVSAIGMLKSRKENRLYKTTTTEPGWLTEKKGIIMPEFVSRLRRKLYQKAKHEPGFRFYTIYVHIYQKDIIRAAWELVKANGGAPGIDGVTIEEVIEGKHGAIGAEIIDELKTKTYKAKPVKRVYIQKQNGKLRPLGIPTVKDRIIQMALLLVLEPIFEADFMECSYGFRPEKSAHQAIKEIQNNIKEGYTTIYDADLQGYFDSIPHEKLMKCVEKRISDRSVLKLIRMWLNAPVIERDEQGKPKPPQKPKKGTPQGGVLSPLLANIYLHWFDKVFHGMHGLFKRIGAKLVRYADDFVIMIKSEIKGWKEWIVNVLEGKFGLVINREKTRILNIDEPGTVLEFLGYGFRFDKSRGNMKYLNICPSNKSIKKEKERLKVMTDEKQCCTPIMELIQRLNSHRLGWANYFSYGYPGKAFRTTNEYARLRLRQHLRRRSQRKYKKPENTTLYHHLKDLGLIYL